MKDTILNVTVITAVFAAIVYAAFDTGSADKTDVAQASRVYEMEKTVVTAKRLPEDVLVASAAQ